PWQLTAPTTPKTVAGSRQQASTNSPRPSPAGSAWPRVIYRPCFRTSVDSRTRTWDSWCKNENNHVLLGAKQNQNCRGACAKHLFVTRRLAQTPLQRSVIVPL